MEVKHLYWVTLTAQGKYLLQSPQNSNTPCLQVCFRSAVCVCGHLCPSFRWPAPAEALSKGMAAKQVCLAHSLGKGVWMLAVIWWEEHGNSCQAQSQHLSSRNLPAISIYATMKDKNAVSPISVYIKMCSLLAAEVIIIITAAYEHLPYLLSLSYHITIHD